MLSCEALGRVRALPSSGLARYHLGAARLRGLRAIARERQLRADQCAKL